MFCEQQESRAVTKTPEELLSLRFGGATVAENLKQAIESGQIIEHADGTLELRRIPNLHHWIDVPYGPQLGCQFSKHFAFPSVYARSAVPYGCRECYKVKVAPRTLRELVAAWQIAKRIACRSKWGIDFDNRYSEDFYAGYFYASGLEAARTIYKVVRQAFDSDPKLGAGLPMRIKRGCSVYEAALGPSDRYEFTPEMKELEDYLKSRFRKREREKRLHGVLVEWIDCAFRRGDQTYLDFTGGKRLRPASMSYDP